MFECKNCTKRYQGCHDTCIDYQTALNEVHKVKKELKEYNYIWRSDVIRRLISVYKGDR